METNQLASPIETQPAPSPHIDFPIQAAPRPESLDEFIARANAGGAKRGMVRRPRVVLGDYAGRRLGWR